MSIKIIHIISSLTRGGRERQLATIVATTDYEKYPTKIIFFNKHQNSYIDEYNLNDITIQIQSHGKIARLKELNRVLQREQPDLVYTWGNGESLSILLLKPFHKFKFINGSVRHGIRSRKFSHYFRTLVLHLSEYVVANSKAGLKANKLRKGEILYNGVDTILLEPLLNRAEKRQCLLGITKDIPLLISVSNLVPYKDYFSILNALKKLKDENYFFYYVILGDGPMHNIIEETIHKLDLKEIVHFGGNVENVSDYLKMSDVFIHSSKGEGCSNAILEAMASGLPIIATNTGGTPEIVTDDNGFLFDYKNHLQLANYIKIILSQNHKTIQMGLKSIQKVKKYFTIDKMMKNYYSIIQNIKNDQ